MRTFILFICICIFPIVYGQTYTVTTELDTVNASDGVLSLREAVASANTTAGKQTITFDPTVFLPGANRIIYLKSALELTDNAGVIISGASGKVTLDGSKIDSAAADFKNGLVLKGGNNNISNLYFRKFLGSAILVDSLNSGNNNIGPDNHISNNRGAGILIIDSENNTITDNEIWNCGMDTLRIGDMFFNIQDGIMLAVNANSNTISGNDVWANYGSGIGSYESEDNTFSGNYIAINYRAGIAISEGSGSNVITDNDLLGNWSNALTVFGGNNADNQITANSIGDTTDVPVEILNLRLPAPESQKYGILFNKVHSANANSSGSQILFKVTPRKGTDMGMEHTIAALDDTVIGLMSGILLQGGSNCLVENNYFYDVNSFAVYVVGYQDIDNSGQIPDTSYYFPEEITIRQNRFERINGTAVLLDLTMGLTVTENYFGFVGGGVAGNGISALTAKLAGLDSSNQGTFTVSNNIFNTSSGGDLRAIQLDAPLPLGGRGAVSITYANKVQLSYNEVVQFYGGFFLYDLNWLQVDNNTLKSINSFGIQIENVKESTVTNNTLEDIASALIKIPAANDFKAKISGKETEQLAQAAGSGGILVVYLSEGDENHSTITKNTLSSVSGFGITGQSLTSAQVRENHIFESNATAIYLMNTRRNEVEENEISGTSNGGIYVTGADTAMIKNNRINDHSNGYNVGMGTVKFAEVINNQCNNASMSGIYATSVDSALIMYNVIRNSDQYGLYFYTGGYARVQYNDIYGSGTGFYPYMMNRVIARFNNFTRNSGDAVSAYYVGEATLNNNNFLENGNSGIMAYACTTAVVDSNYFSMNRYGLFSYFFDSLRIKYNSFVKNTDYGVYNGDTDTLDATMNYWGHSNGPALSDTLYPGIAWGDKITDRVLYDPYLMAPVKILSMYPAIEAIEPAQSPREGGGNAALRGRQFLPGAQVKFGTTPVKKVVFMASNLLALEIPPGKGGNVDLIVLNPDGRADTLKNGFFYDNHAPLPFDLISPSIPDTVYSPTPDFKWTTSVDPDGDDVEYVLMYSLYDTFKDSVYFAGIEDTVFTLKDDSLSELTTYYWRVLARDNLGGYAISSTQKLETGKFSSGPNGISALDNLLPDTYALYQNYPNPFNPTTTIRYDIIEQTHVEISVYNTLGQKVATLVNKQQKPGRYSVNWNAREFASGLYFYIIRSEHFTKTRKLILLK